MNIADKVKDMGLELPATSSPGGNYVSLNIRNRIAYLAIQFPALNKVFSYQGRLGQEFTTEEGYKAFQQCALNVLSHLHAKVGIENIEGMNHMDAYYQSANDWDEGRIAVDGASDLFTKVLGEKGIHSRAIFGVERLPRNFVGGITCTFTLK
jgi:hypothetical protein